MKASNDWTTTRHSGAARLTAELGFSKLNGDPGAPDKAHSYGFQVNVLKDLVSSGCKVHQLWVQEREQLWV